MEGEQEKKFGQEKKLMPGDVIFKEGDKGNEMYLIKSGSVKITKKIGGKEKVLAVLSEGDFFGEMSVLDGSLRSASASTEEETELIIVDRAAFLAQARENPFIEYVIETLIKRLRETDDMLKFLFIKNEDRRLTTYILNKAKGEGVEKNGEIDTGIDFNPESIGNAIGLDTRKVNEIIAKLVRANLINISENKVFVKRLDLLEQYLDYIQLKEKFER